MNRVIQILPSAEGRRIWSLNGHRCPPDSRIFWFCERPSTQRSV